MKRLTILLAALLAAGCAAGPPDSCPAGLTPGVRAEAFFGRSAAGVQVVDDAGWAAFLDQVVTPAFPDGLTVLDAAGQWRGSTGQVAREAAKLLVVVLPGADAAQAADRLAPVASEYRERFGQESVLLLAAPTCLRF
ncbi:DUF3574 domain-containing protein [Falsiroseomonas selenitidurans]|uniref:DUF3574 domain-containing protein n=1 Tax=Falsiroseomonas selenitidurans TaxID=2716335 RepID=A0ABX1E425_9PROT|nr:DUF3574 domain-containing protein [Falsiroseomonas selenitidurans]NKC31936.1 DUF3574 domain-containing protein [Falsiroseomonas selenitidurans]